MKIIFLNAWNGKLRDELNTFLQHEVPTTDIFCFQEATAEMKHNSQDILADYTEISDYKFVTERDEYPQSIFIRKNIEIVSSGTLMQADQTQGLAVYAELLIDSKKLYVCNMHGTARPDDKNDSPNRIKQSKDLIEFFKNKDAPVIIGGDFNMNPDTEAMRMFAKNGYKDLIKEFNIDTTRNEHAWKYPVKLMYSDYAFINEKIECKSFEVPKNKISDHLPLILEFEI